MRENHFYMDLPAFARFADFVDDQHFYQVPDSWWLVITDVKGSTDAISKGRYQEVNLVGSATITALLNACGVQEIPFVFGGDGATMLVPDELMPKARAALLQTEELSMRDFGLELRVGAVPVAELRRQGHSVLCGKHEIAKDNFLAVFRGTGFSVAEKWIKGKGPHGENYLIQPTDEEHRTNHETLLEGLSCRWQPLPSRHGQIVSMIVVARGESKQRVRIFSDMLQEVQRILAYSHNEGSPITPKQMRAARLFPSVTKEAKLSGKKGWAYIQVWLKVLMMVIFARILFRFKAKLGPFSAQEYLEEISVNTDHKKFDEALRMILDCTPAEVEALKYILDKYKTEGQIFYGLHFSNQALMTCYVRQPYANKHVHFIDGAGGGYALAAKELKGQIREAAG